MSNPVLNESSFKRAAGMDTFPPPDLSGRSTTLAPPATTQQGGMTINGTIASTLALLALLLAAAFVGWQLVDVSEDNVVSFPSWSIALVLGGFVCVLVASFKPRLAPILGALYAVLQGMFLGAVSHAYEAWQDGIVFAAIGATLGVFTVMLLLYRFRIIKVTQKLRSIIMGATLGLMLFYLVAWIADLFGGGISIINSTSALGIGFSVLAAGLAAFNLLLDFDFIERGSRSGAPSYMNWLGALGLVVTLVWLYLEMLRLLSKLQDR
jgi:uncharacterized YccA/Bax inhibitor family protein